MSAGASIPFEGDVILITSSGRTGTSFFGQVLERLVDDCFSVHEPDVWHGLFRRNSWRAIRWFGVYHVVVGKLLRKTGMRCVTERYLSGDWTGEEAAAAVVRQREGFYRSRPASLVAESNTQWYGLLPLLPRILRSYRVLALVRDPRTWVRSWMNYRGHHDALDPVTRLGLPRISPGMVGGEWANRWDDMDVFQRLCWDWRFISERLARGARADDRIRLLRFEDLFQAPDRRERLDETLAFITDFGHRRYPYRVPPGIFDHKVNVSEKTRLGPWSEWRGERRAFLLEMCGELAGRLGYELERPPGARSGSGA